MRHLLTILSLLAGLTAWGEIIPADRRITWQGNVGIPGGITNRQQWCNVKTSIPGTPLRATGNGSTDDTAALQYALDHCTNGGMVYIPAGIYRVTKLVITNSITVRGAGRDTVISGIAGTDRCGIMCFGPITDGWTGGTYLNSQGSFGNGYPTAPTSISGATKGARSITVSNPTGINVGTLMCIDELNNTEFVKPIIAGNACASRGYVDGQAPPRLAGQVVYVTNVIGNTIYFDPPLFWSFTNTPEVVTVPCFARYAGIEDLRVYANNTDYNANFTMIGNAYCWLKNVEGDYADGNQATILTTVRCEIRDSYFHDGFKHGAGGTDDCLLIGGHSTGILIENNIFRRLHVSVMVEHGGGGHVIAYNYSTNNYSTVANTSVMPYYVYHGPHPAQVLWEGNYGGKFSSDGVFGSASHSTFFRNYAYGAGWSCPPYDSRGAEQTNSYMLQYASARLITLSGGSSYFNTVGNVIGNNWLTTLGYTMYYESIWPAADDYYGIYMYFLGYDGGNGGTGTLPYDTLLRHGDWDCITKRQSWDATISDTNIPPSLYLGTTRPAFFGNLTWPPVDPARGYTNLTAMSLPAGYRYTYGTNPPPPGVNITAQPSSQHVTLTSNATFTVTATGSGALTYQWRTNTVNLTNSAKYSYCTTDRLRVNSAQVSDEQTNYNVVVTSGINSVTSAYVSLTTHTNPYIVTQPVSATATQTFNASFSVTAVGTAPLSYQWEKYFSPSSQWLTYSNWWWSVPSTPTDGWRTRTIEPDTNSSLRLTNVIVTHVGSYRVRVSNALSSSNSDEVTLSVLRAPRSAIVHHYSSTNAIGTAIVGNTNSSATTDTIWDGSGSWINATRFTNTSSGSVTKIVARVAEFGGNLKCAIYGGGLTNFLMGTTAISPSDGWNDFPLTSPLTLTNGNVYWLAIWSDRDGARVYMNPSGGLTCWHQYDYGDWPDPLVITVGGTANYCIYAVGGGGTNELRLNTTGVNYLGGTSQFVVSAGGASGLKYQWKRGAAYLNGATQNTLTLSPLKTSDSGTYTCVITNAYGSITSPAYMGALTVVERSGFKIMQ